MPCRAVPLPDRRTSYARWTMDDERSQEDGRDADGDGDGDAAADPTPVRRRGTIACRRCRRLRTKCVHDGGAAPCEMCRLAGAQVSAQCAFPRRGERDFDRQFRRRPVLVDDVRFVKPETPSTAAADYHVAGGQAVHAAGAHRGKLLDPGAMQPGSSLQLSSTAALLENPLPPPEEIVEGCRIFVTSYFQLGFIPKAVFLEGLVRQPSSVSKFLLATILSISARFTPSLIRRYGSAAGATDYFLEVSKSMVPEEMYQPSLERIQAFFLLAIARWGNGDRDRSNMDMGVAVRMAGLRKLHCEESYAVDKTSSAEDVVQSESARRVFWMIQSQENLHSGYLTPSPFPLEDVTTLLPCDEGDFAFGVIPAERAAVAGTPPALANPALVSSPTRCLFATLIQAHGLWGKVSRRACRTDYVVNRAPPWDANSEFHRATTELREWEESLPAKHEFSVWNLRGWKSESLHLAYLSVTMVLRLSNIVTRRIYLDDMLLTLTNESPGQPLEPSTPTMANVNDQRGQTYPKPLSSTTRSYGVAPPGFWHKMSEELFSNVWELHEQVDAYFSMRTPDEGFPQILVFCVYMCGSLASYLWRYPALCPKLAQSAELMAQRSLEVLSELHAAWPTSSKWQMGLQQITNPLHVREQGAIARQKSNRAATKVPTQLRPTSMPVPVNNFQPMTAPVDHRPTVPEGMLGELVNVLPNGNSNLVRLGNMQMNALPNELFDAELNAFLQGDFHYNLVDGWQYDPMG